MSAYNRYAYSSGGNFYRIILHYFTGLFHHFHFFFGVSVFQEYIYLRYHIQVNRIFISHFSFHFFSFIEQLVHRFFPCARYTLISAYHHSFYFIFFMQRLQCNYHLYGRAIRISNDKIIFGQHFGIYFRHYQFFCGVHSPGTAVVNYSYTSFCKFWCPFQ